MSVDVGQLLRDRRTNAVLSWLLAGVIAVAALRSVLRGQLLWGGFALVVLGLTVLPPVTLRDATATLPWEVTAVAALPILGRTFATVELTGDLATYLSVAAIALVVAVELHLFTPVRMNDSFAVGFVVVATMATAGLWAVIRWGLDVLAGTSFILTGQPESVVEHQLMLEFVASTVAGVVAGVLFALYVHRVVDHDTRLPEEVPR